MKRTVLSVLLGLLLLLAFGASGASASPPGCAVAKAGGGATLFDVCRFGEDQPPWIRVVDRDGDIIVEPTN